MFEDIFNGFEDSYDDTPLYACESAIAAANYYGFDLAACYEADESGTTSEPEAKKKFGQRLAAGLSKAGRAIKQFVNFLIRKVKELFLKLANLGKTDYKFYMDPGQYNYYMKKVAAANKTINLVKKALPIVIIPKVVQNQEKINAYIAQIENLEKQSSGEVKLLGKQQVYAMPKEIGNQSQMEAEIKELGNEADSVGENADVMSDTSAAGLYSRLKPMLLRKHADALKVKVEFLSKCLAAPHKFNKENNGKTVD